MEKKGKHWWQMRWADRGKKLVSKEAFQWQDKLLISVLVRIWFICSHNRVEIYLYVGIRHLWWKIRLSLFLLLEADILGRLNLKAAVDLTLFPYSSFPVSHCRGYVNISWSVLAVVTVKNAEEVCSFSFHVME